MLDAYMGWVTSLTDTQYLAYLAGSMLAGTALGVALIATRHRP